MSSAYDKANQHRLQWACRRGMLELDIVLERYLHRQYADASAAEQAQFQALLLSTDQDLFDWVLEKREAPAEWQALLLKIRTGGRSHVNPE